RPGLLDRPWPPGYPGVARPAVSLSHVPKVWDSGTNDEHKFNPRCDTNPDSELAIRALSPMSREPPILIVPYMWIGDFVRCHTVVKLLRERYPSRPIDVLTTTMDAPLLDYMPGVRKGIVADLPRKRLALAQHRALSARLRPEGYGQALVMPRTWKSALAPYL